MKQVCYQIVLLTAWKVFKYGVISSPNAWKYRLEKTPYLDTFHAVAYSSNLLWSGNQMKRNIWSFNGRTHSYPIKRIIVFKHFFN